MSWTDCQSLPVARYPLPVESPPPFGVLPPSSTEETQQHRPNAARPEGAVRPEAPSNRRPPLRSGGGERAQRGRRGQSTPLGRKDPPPPFGILPPSSTEGDATTLAERSDAGGGSPARSPLQSTSSPAQRGRSTSEARPEGAVHPARPRRPPSPLWGTPPVFDGGRRHTAERSQARGAVRSKTPLPPPVAPLPAGTPPLRGETFLLETGGWRLATEDSDTIRPGVRKGP